MLGVKESIRVFPTFAMFVTTRICHGPEILWRVDRWPAVQFPKPSRTTRLRYEMSPQRDVANV